MSLRPIGWVFLLFGVFWGGWAVAATDVERTLHLSIGGFGLLLSFALVGAASANAVGGGLCERFGTGKVLGASLLIWAVLLSLGAIARESVLLGLLIIVMVATAGLIDIAINVAATEALADTPGRLVAFHSQFNAGAAAGAAVTGVLLAVGGSWRWVWVGVALAALCLGVECQRVPLPAGERGDHVPMGGALSLLHRERLLLLAGTFALAAMVEGGIELWGVLFLRTHLSSGLLLGAGGAVLGYSIAAVARYTLGPTIGRNGSGRGVTIGAGTAALGVAILATAPKAVIAAIGLVLAAGGISMCWPLLVAQAGARRPRAGEVVGAVSAVGYLGLVIGPAVVGWVAEAVGLRIALGVLAAAALIVALVPTRSSSFVPTGTNT
ncbi:MAG: MFS transporter [Acidimicrobiales bacterium]